MRLLLIEPEATGHRMILYVRFISEEALRRGWRVTLMTTASAFEHAACRTVVSSLGGDFHVTFMPECRRATASGKLALLARQRAYLRAFEQGYRRYAETASVEFVYVPYLNYIDKALALFGSPFGATPFGGMIVSAHFHHKACGIAHPGASREFLNRLLFRRLLSLKKLALATTIDEPLPGYASSTMPAGSAKVRYVPDVSVVRRLADRRTARHALGLEDEHFVVLAYGSLSRRKGLAQLMMMFGAHDLPKHYRLVLAGVQDAEATAIVGSFMARAGERRAQVLTLNKFCSEAEEATVFGAADLVWLCYENFSGMSGVLIQAAQAGVPVITSHVGLIDYVRGKRSLGLRWDDILMERSPELRFDWAKLESVSHAMKGSAKLAAFADEHSPGKFGRNVIDEIAVHGAVRR